MSGNLTAAGHSDEPVAYMDTLLREALPEIKLALGELIDRENVRTLPGNYAKLLPESLLVVTLRPDAAEALAPLAQNVERDLTDSVMRHGSLYDRAYRVQLRRSEDPDAPLYQVSSYAGHSSSAQPPHEDLAPGAADHAAPPRAVAALPVSDPDATRVEEAGPPGWEPGRWVLVVEDLSGEQREVFRLTDSYSTVGRRSDDPQLRTTIALRDVPHVSRRQLALLWEERDGAPGFRVYNLGLNPVHVPGQDIAGAHVGKGRLELERLPADAIGWVPPGVPMSIGEHGPVLRVDEIPPDEQDEEFASDPEATRYE